MVCFYRFPLLLVVTISIAGNTAAQTTASKESSKPAKRQQICLPETDNTSLRHTSLKETTTNSQELIRTDADKDGDPDIVERWWNGKRVRWFDEDDNMTATDVHGDQVNDALQVDRDGDGFYDGPDDMNVDWVDDDSDGDADLQIVTINPNSEQANAYSGSAHFMIFEDVDDDNVHGYIDWQTFEFPCWRATNTTHYPLSDLKTNFSPDYNGNSIFLKEHLAPMSIEDVRYNWENPFAFYDFDGDGVTEMAVRLCDNKISVTTGSLYKYDGKNDEAYVAFDLDNDTQRGNEMDYDMTLKFIGGEMMDYRKYVHKHPKMPAPKWVLPYFRYTNWREIDELIYVPHDKCFEEAFKPKWGTVYMVFDEDDDDHRWERVELYYPNDPYDVSRRGKGKKGGGLSAHPQSDLLGDRGEWDMDNSGQGHLYLGKWDDKLHMLGAEWGAWTVDYDGKYWGSSPIIGDSSPKAPESAEEVVHYKDTDNNGFFDLIEYDYDGDKKMDLSISLKELGISDKAEIIVPAKQEWKGMHEKFNSASAASFQEALLLYRAMWKVGLTDRELDDLAIAASSAEQYDHGYWLKEKAFRLLDKKLADSTPDQQKVRKMFFSGEIKQLAEFVEARSWN